MPEPTKRWVQDTAEQMRRFYRQRDENILAWRSLYFLDDEAYFVDPEGEFVPQEDDEIRVMLPLAQAIIDTYQAMLFAQLPTLDVPASSIMEVDKTHAEKLEAMLYAIWDRSSIFRAVKDAGWHGLTDGWAVLQVVFDPEAEESGDVPVYVKSLDPMGVWPMPGNRPGEWKYVITVSYELVGTLRRTFVDGRDGRTSAVKSTKRVLSGMDEDDRVMVLDYWDDEYHGMMIVPMDTKSEEIYLHQGEWVLEPAKHKYGVLPFAIWHGNALPMRDRGERMGVSVLWPIGSLLRYLTKLASQKATIIGRYASPTIVTKTEDGRGFDAPGQLGDQIPLFPEESVELLLPSGPAPEVSFMFEEMMGAVESASLPRHVMGQLNVGRLSGVAMNLLRTPVLMKIAFKQQDIERAMEEINEVILHMVEHRMRTPVYVWGVNAKKKDIEVVIDPALVAGYYRNRVRLSASLPTDEPATVAMLASLKQMNIISDQTFRNIVQQTLRDLSPQSLDAEEIQILIETVAKLPPVQMAMMLEAARAADLDVLPLLEKMLGGQQGGQGSQPSLPGMGSQAGLSPTNPLQQQGGSVSNPRSADIIKNLASQVGVAGAQGGRPPSPMESPGPASGLGPTSVAGQGAVSGQ